MTPDIQQQQKGLPERKMEPLQPVSRQDFGFLIVWSILIPFWFPLIGIITGLVNIRRPGSGRYIGVASSIFLFEFILTIGLGEYIPGRKHQLENVVKDNVFSIQRELEQYANDHAGLYPRSIQGLVDTGYISELPMNPFTKKPTCDIRFGSSPFVGEFTYVPVLEDDQVYGYYLMAYGTPELKITNMDVDGDGIGDHVIWVQESASLLDNSAQSSSAQPEGAIRSHIDLPTLEELLKAQKENPQAQTSEGQKSAGGE